MLGNPPTTTSPTTPTDATGMITCLIGIFLHVILVDVLIFVLFIATPTPTINILRKYSTHN